MNLHQHSLSAYRWVLVLLGVQTAAAAASYDYVVIGGGPGGLVVANRLSENASVTVAVIEAGDQVLDNSVVADVSNPFASLGTPLDWQYNTAPQKYAGNATQVYHAGKALGGTSTINGMTYLRAERSQINAWESLGNKGWTWSSLFPYYKKSEHFNRPTPSQVADGAAYDAAAHGGHGPLSVGWHSITPEAGNATAVVQQTWSAVGLSRRDEPNGGRMSGFSVWPFTANTTTNTRGDAARQYYLPVKGRPNLHVYLNTTATRILWNDASGKPGSRLRATAVEIVPNAGEMTTVEATNEVVVSAGATRTLLLLEFSGIGNPAVLDVFGIPVRINLPGVGENPQDQVNVGLVAPLVANDTTFVGYPAYVAYPTARDLFGSNLSSVEATVRSSIPSYAALNVAASRNGSATTLSVQKRLLQLQADLIFKNADAIPVAEILPAPISPVVYMAVWGLLPLGRGSVHIASSSPLSAQPAAIDPSFFMNPFDNTIQVAAMRLARRAMGTAPLVDYITPEGLAALPAVDASDEAWLAVAKSTYTSNSHPLGTAAMMARELGGVVDENLKVYGTANVRVVDASVVPLQVCGHLTSTIYALAERASDIIKGSV